MNFAIAGCRGVSSRGSGAPIFTHASRSAICAALSFVFGGIFSSGSDQRIASISRLFSGSPATKLGPLSPPLSKAARVSSSSPPFAFPDSVLWHL